MDLNAPQRKPFVHRLFLLILRKAFLSRFRVLALLLVLLASGAGGALLAQLTCVFGCERQFVSCVIEANGDPIMEAACQDAYDDCADGCLDQ